MSPSAICIYNLRFVLISHPQRVQIDCPSLVGVRLVFACFGESTLKVNEISTVETLPRKLLCSSRCERGVKGVVCIHASLLQLSFNKFPVQIRLDFEMLALVSGGVEILPCFLKIFLYPANVENPSVSIEQQFLRSTTHCLAPKATRFLLVDFSWFSRVRAAGVLGL